MADDRDFYTRVREGDFQTKLPYASHRVDSVVHKAYRDDEARLHEEFKKALAKEYGVENHPKRALLFSIAWEHGHSAGQSEVANCYGEFVDLITPIKVKVTEGVNKYKKNTFFAQPEGSDLKVDCVLRAMSIQQVLVDSGVITIVEE